MKKRWLILAFVLSALGTGLFSAPAAYLYAWLAPVGLPVVPAGIDGTVSNGTVRALAWQGRTVVRDVAWDWRPTDLFTLSAGWDLRFAGTATGESAVRVSLGGTPDVSDLRAVADVAAILEAAGYSGLPLRGRVVAEVERLRVSPAGLPESVTGNVQLLQLAWSVGSNPLVMGDFRADVSTDAEGRLVADITSADDSPVEATGEASLGPDGSYEAHVRVRARPDAPEQIRNLIGLIGRPDNDGFYHLRQRGRL